MTRYFKFNDTQLNQTDTFEAQDQPGDQLGLWFTFSISILSAGFIILVLESLKHKPNGVYPEGVMPDTQEVMTSEGTNPGDFNVNGFFSVLSDEQAQSNQFTLYCPA